MNTKRLLSLAISLALAGALAGCDKPASESEMSSNAAPAQTQVADQQATAYVDTEHNARNSLDWNGTYVGTIPCADCEGIETVLVLDRQGTFELTETYLGKDGEQFSDRGKFSWNDAGNTITLTNDSGEGIQFFVGENQLFRLDRQGQRITGSLAEMYVLTKQHSQ
ncbi:copper resistance protein NlpE [Photobacterium halotolerans]|uniref:Copper resistance protein NlpE n=1 Tax=Photobacterium halotolerans TaxID=265726 RepID=A0A7X4W7P2_9GAMM|nr:copper resistance protein NlpE [Photobacterium halotolerans]NAW63598.1 copper resistance protein NlpE [Photobacterium halotolerans]NAW85665.1 copper resistance protein NlpE [Photobacterium halotolerans]NAX46549.1 copper resistance protein NlpE [Photobacterium halotolerans]